MKYYIFFLLRFIFSYVLCVRYKCWRGKYYDMEWYVIICMMKKKRMMNEKERKDEKSRRKMSKSILMKVTWNNFSQSAPNCIILHTELFRKRNLETFFLHFISLSEWSRGSWCWSKFSHVYGMGGWMDGWIQVGRKIQEWKKRK